VRPAGGVTVIGHSYGSVVTGLAAAHLPAQVKDLVRIGSRAWVSRDGRPAHVGARAGRASRPATGSLGAGRSRCGAPGTARCPRPGFGDRVFGTVGSATTTTTWRRARSPSATSSRSSRTPRVRRVAPAPMSSVRARRSGVRVAVWVLRLPAPGSAHMSSIVRWRPAELVVAPDGSAYEAAMSPARRRRPRTAAHGPPPARTQCSMSNTLEPCRSQVPRATDWSVELSRPGPRRDRRRGPPRGCSRAARCRRGVVVVAEDDAASRGDRPRPGR
jgi:hypothetical protein